MKKVKAFIVFMITIAMISLVSPPYQDNHHSLILENKNEETIKILEENFEKVLISLEEQRKAEEAEIKALEEAKAKAEEEERKRLEEERAKKEEAERVNRVRHPMQHPKQSYVTSEYGMRCDVPGVYSGCLFHSGIDFGNGPTVGEFTYPAAAGIVSFVGNFDGAYPACGFYVAVWHERFNLTTIYCHLADYPLVAVGDHVDPDTALGEVGTTGMSNGIHLHFMTIYGDSYVGETFDPRIWFSEHDILL